jgi:hypothetical protein
MEFVNTNIGGAILENKNICVIITKNPRFGFDVSMVVIGQSKEKVAEYETIQFTEELEKAKTQTLEFVKDHLTCLEKQFLSKLEVIKNLQGVLK